MAVVFSNNAKTTLASSVSTSATSISVADGSVFPALSGSDYAYVTFEDTSGNVEIVKLTALSGNTLTVVRAQDNTSARAFSSGDKCELRLTAAGLNEVTTLPSNIAAVSLDISGDIDVDGTTNLDVVDIDGAVDMASTLQVDGAATFTTEITANGGIALGDNDKATFGAGDDLQIYHDGANSYIRDTGTGNLNISADQLRVLNAGNNEIKAGFTTDGAVDLYHNNALKLSTTSTGIDVTGNITITGDNVLDVTQGNNSSFFRRNASQHISVVSDSSQHRLLATGSIDKSFIIANTTGAIVFSPANTERMRIDASGNVGIGTASPGGYRLNVSTGATGNIAQLTDGVANTFIIRSDASTLYAGNANNYPLAFVTNNTERMRISGANVGIGTTTPQAKLDVADVSNFSTGYNTFTGDGLHIQSTGTGGADAYSGGISFSRISADNNSRAAGIAGVQGADADQLGLAFFTHPSAITTGSLVEAMRIDSSGLLKIGTSGTVTPYSLSKFAIDTGTYAFMDLLSTGASGINFGDAGGAQRGTIEYNHASDYMRFGSAGGERMRIDSSGRVGIGTSDPSSYWANADDLVVSTSGNTGISVVSGTTSLGYLIFADSTGGGDNTRGGLGYDHSTNSMLFRGNNTERMRIDASGNVGIGTASPARGLHVNNNGESFIRVTSSNTGNAGIEFGDQSDGVQGAIFQNSTDNSLRFNGYNNSEAMRIDASGNVSIGMTYNYAKLNVNGDIRAENSRFLAGREDASAPAFAFHDDGDTGIFNIHPNILGFSTAGTERMRIGTSETVINEGSADYDFRVESDTNANALFVQGSDGRIGVGTGTSLDNQLEVAGGNVRVRGTTTPSLKFNNNELETLAIKLNSGSTGTLGLRDNKVLIDSNGGFITNPIAGGHAVFNETGVDADFRVESNDNAHMLFVDASTNRVGIGQSVPDEKLHVIDNSNSATMPLVIGNEDHTDNSTSHAVQLGFGLARDSGTVKNNAGTIKVGKIAAWTGDDNLIDSYMSFSTYLNNASVERLSITSNETVFNDTGLNHDFRVESNDNATMLVVDAGTNRVGVGISAPTATADIRGANTAIFGRGQLYISNTESAAINQGSQISLGGTYTGTGDTFFASISGRKENGTSGNYSGYLSLATRTHGGSNTERLRISSTGAATFSSTLATTELNVSQSANSTRSYKLLQGYGYTTGGNYYGQYAIGTTYNSSANTGTLEFFTGSGSSAPTNRLTIDSSGNTVFNETGVNADFRVESDSHAHALFVDAGTSRVGINKAAPDTLLHLSGADTAVIRLENTDTSLGANQLIGALEFEKQDGSGAGAGVFGGIRMRVEDSVGANAYMTFSTGWSSGMDTERVRIQSSGGFITNPIAGGHAVFNEGGIDADFRVESDAFSSALAVEGSSGKVNVAAHFGIGKTSAGEQQSAGSGFFFVPGSSGYYSHISTVDTANFSSYINRKTQTGGFFSFFVDNGGVGSITTNGSNTVYGTSSDERLKENIADADDAGSKIDAMQVRKFDWKRNGHHQEYGMVAQELLPISPDSIAQGETEEDMMSVDYSALVPMLIKEIQSLRQRVAQLEE